MKDCANSKLDKSECKVFYCLVEKLDVEAKLHEVLQNNWQVMRKVVLGQSSLSYLCTCSGTCRVVVASLGGDFGRRREKVIETWRGFLLLESGRKFGW